MLPWFRNNELCANTISCGLQSLASPISMSSFIKSEITICFLPYQKAGYVKDMLHSLAASNEDLEESERNRSVMLTAVSILKDYLIKTVSFRDGHLNWF